MNYSKSAHHFPLLNKPRRRKGHKEEEEEDKGVFDPDLVLDYWREYTLVRIGNLIDIDRRQIYLLKMTFPSSRNIHALRVPPDMQSAREAIRWVNWGIDPEEFYVQT